MGIHAEKITGKDVGFIASGGTSDLHDDVFVIILIFGQKGDLEIFSLLLDGSGEAVELFLGEDLGLWIRIFHHLRGI